MVGMPCSAVRLYRWLKEGTIKPLVALLRTQQNRFDRFHQLFNNERLHEVLNNQMPASLCHSNSVRLPRKIPAFPSPKRLLLRRVNNSGDISWHKNRVFVREVFHLEELVNLRKILVLAMEVPAEGVSKAQRRFADDGLQPGADIVVRIRIPDKESPVLRA